jgi:hypothetical protein
MFHPGGDDALLVWFKQFDMCLVLQTYGTKGDLYECDEDGTIRCIFQSTDDVF